ncbi:MAG: hypothetical protein LC624_00190 [Halobacteriales archaeon]|nr:hypothetical protein [Halobacteriales archaeon]
MRRTKDVVIAFLALALFVLTAGWSSALGVPDEVGGCYHGEYCYQINHRDVAVCFPGLICQWVWFPTPLPPIPGLPYVPVPIGLCAIPFVCF